MLATQRGKQFRRSPWVAALLWTDPIQACQAAILSAANYNLEMFASLLEFVRDHPLPPEAGPLGVCWQRAKGNLDRSLVLQARNRFRCLYFAQLREIGALPWIRVWVRCVGVAVPYCFEGPAPLCAFTNTVMGAIGPGEGWRGCLHQVYRDSTNGVQLVSIAKVLREFGDWFFVVYYSLFQRG
jgi:hypothetical protein